jgi:hypothetical protein
MPGKLKPLDVERETRPGKYPDGDVTCASTFRCAKPDGLPF